MSDQMYEVPGDVLRELRDKNDALQTALSVTKANYEWMKNDRDALRSKLDEAKALLDRLSHWDMLWLGDGQKSIVADGEYWKREIDEALRKLEA